MKAEKDNRNAQLKKLEFASSELALQACKLLGHLADVGYGRCTADNALHRMPEVYSRLLVVEERIREVRAMIELEQEKEGAK